MATDEQGRKTGGKGMRTRFTANRWRRSPCRTVHSFSKKIKRLCIKIPIHVGSKACSLVLKKNDSTVQSMINKGPPPLKKRRKIVKKCATFVMVS